MISQSRFSDEGKENQQEYEEYEETHQESDVQKGFNDEQYETEMNALYQDDVQYQEDGIKSFGADSDNHIKTLGFLQKFNVTQISLTDCYNVILTNPPTQVTKLIVNFCNIKSLDGLQDMIHLQILNLSHNKIKDIKLLGTLKSLKDLNIADNKLTDISQLKNITTLIQLNIRSNKIDDISVIQSLNNLENLDYFYHNKIQDITVLLYFTKFKEINMSYNKINNISALKNLPELKCLCLCQNNIKDISVLQYLPNLENLDLSKNYISNISVLKTLITLKIVNLSYNPITNFNFIKYLKNLSSLNLNSCNIVDITFLKGLSCLKAVQLEENKIINISSLKYLEFNELDLRYNRLSNFSDIQQHKNYNRYMIDGQIEATPKLVHKSNNMAAIFDITEIIEELQNKQQKNYHFAKVQGIINLRLQHTISDHMQFTNKIVNLLNQIQNIDQ
ncbi:leucine-rich_repeat domain-containing protein [Hexamita inflata]|uniref:Leucine-rich repeat domain-containing protein n=1 Tax=Hexamita inflata TaxID=28002 RepID=A0AA86TJW3_9EUKA|nr:leucine-rich repeat domain-containing protein [Hexamita inflata]